MNVVGDAGRVDKDAATRPEDEPLAEGLALAVSSNELVTQLLKNDHILVDDWEYKSHVTHASVPLSTLVLRQNSL